jgi:hypothetical protein
MNTIPNPLRQFLIAAGAMLVDGGAHEPVLTPT